MRVKALVIKRRRASPVSSGVQLLGMSPYIASRKKGYESLDNTASTSRAQSFAVCNAATAEGYAQLQQDITAILDGKAGALSLYTENGWQGTVLCTELPGAEDAAAALKRCWQAAKPDAALPVGSRLELVCWDPAQNRKCQLPVE